MSFQLVQVLLDGTLPVINVLLFMKNVERCCVIKLFSLLISFSGEV